MTRCRGTSRVVALLQQGCECVLPYAGMHVFVLEHRCDALLVTTAYTIAHGAVYERLVVTALWSNWLHIKICDGACRWLSTKDHKPLPCHAKMLTHQWMSSIISQLLVMYRDHAGWQVRVLTWRGEGGVDRLYLLVCTGTLPNSHYNLTVFMCVRFRLLVYIRLQDIYTKTTPKCLIAPVDILFV